MARPVFNSLDELLAPGTLSEIEGRRVTAVTRRPFGSVDSLSGSHFLAVETGGEPGQRYVVKRIARAWDWLMRVTGDEHGRPVVAWRTGLLDRLPPEITHGIAGCARDGDGWAILMHDFSDHLIPPGDAPISAADNERFLDGMAATHAACWGRPELADPALGFCDLRHHYLEFAPAVVRQEVGAHPIPAQILAGWALVPELLAADVAAIVLPLLEDATPLCAALERFPQTVIHGDWKLGNLGLLPPPGRQIILLDWAVVGPAPPAVDLAWYLAVNSARLPVTKEAAIACFRAQLARRLGARFDAAWWAPQLALALLGGFLQLGWPKLLGAAHGETEAVRAREQAELTWWSARIRAAARYL
jgi:hypothetical protein